MNVSLEYNFRSAVVPTASGQTLAFAPNLAREPVAFDAPLRQPVRFREAISALHDVVISDLRFKKKDKSGYIAWKKNQQELAARARHQNVSAVYERLKQAQNQPLPDALAEQFDASRKKYWNARNAYDRHLRQADPELWRKLVPYDPVITVAPDVCLFECFSGDESSYGCLSVDREAAFGRSDEIQFGTTNVDYSWDLYHHFQTLRSYRETRFRLDPHGFESTTAGGGGEHREEKIDLPTSWLRGFMQLQVAMGLPATRITLGREAVYALLAWHKRHRAATSPRALRFELIPGFAPRLVLEPWEQKIETYGPVYDGPPVAPIRVWGVRRLLMMARLLPLVDRFTVHLLGNGLPHFWVAEMGDMRLTLGFSGWTANDWTRASALEMLQSSGVATQHLVGMTAEYLRQSRSATLAEIERGVDRAGPPLRAALSKLANAGQVIYDLHAGVYRWRQIMPKPLGEAEVGPEPDEMRGLREVLASGRTKIDSRTEIPGVGVLLQGHDVEVLVDFDGRVKRGKCLCGWFRRYGLKNGPCRHMMALRYLDPQRLGGAIGAPPLR
ncbi:hypothetical protein [Humisphaera borealis]|uniref:Metal-binding protein n=1 Tax=Humisphaera borealis TaxID=2807512 RepID=A0A7M2X3Z8_9BACT|nr:hypothetical protein [Humisphaera borealis]QOV92172.1 metal-binding protein [Humisphaera borealis]